jgi:hypothetical protein
MKEVYPEEPSGTQISLDDGIRSPFLIAETLMFIDVWRFVGQVIGQLNDQSRLILQNVQRQVSFARIGSEQML